jgi:hypothetical protein
VLVMVVKVVVKVFVGVLLFSLSPTPTQTTHPRTRPAARSWAWGAKGLGCLIVAPAPGASSGVKGVHHSGPGDSIPRLRAHTSSCRVLGGCSFI